jgi:hypothetical protein
VDREIRKGIIHINGLSVMVKEGGSWLSDPISCADVWSVSRDDDENVFSSFAPSDDRVMVSE